MYAFLRLFLAIARRTSFFGIAHRDVRLLAALPGDGEEDKFLWRVKEAEALLNLRRMDMGLRPTNVFRRDRLLVFLVGELACFLQELD